MCLTENGSATYISSGNPCLDFFFHVVPDTPSDSLVQRLELAWEHDALKTLKLICNLRGVRGTGKSDREGYYTAALWLHKNHPKTLACNIRCMAEFGYFKDFLEILFRLVEGEDARKLGKEKHLEWELHGKNRYKKSYRKLLGLGEMRKADDANLSLEEKKIKRAKKVVDKLNCDFGFKFLHEKVSDLFAECLRSDMKCLKDGKLFEISLAAKWCPSLGSSFDQFTLLCETITKKVFPRQEYEEYVGVEEAHYVYCVKYRLRKEVLGPLRKALELPEVYIGANKWELIPYNRVASVAMKRYKNMFLKHDGERFAEYLGKVKTGTAKIAAGALLPHEIIAGLNDSDKGEVSELQWKKMVDDMTKKGTLNNCLAICDVSGSMDGVPMEVSVALGVLVSELSDEPWRGKLITFSANPELQMVEGETLKDKTEFVRNMDWGMNTDLQKVFDLILNVAVSGKLKPDEMIKRLFVFSDMEFDQATKGCYSNPWGMEFDHANSNPWKTDYEMIVKKFRKAGYGDCVPEIVFWNLRDSMATPVPSNQPGVALVSGFSKNLLSMFLEEGGVISPEAVMDQAISGEEYQKLVVLD